MEVTIIRTITMHYSLIIYYLYKKDDKVYSILYLAEESNSNKEITWSKFRLVSNIIKLKVNNWKLNRKDQQKLLFL
jgi:hypothetical protein